MYCSQKLPRDMLPLQSATLGSRSKNTTVARDSRFSCQGKMFERLNIELFVKHSTKQKSFTCVSRLFAKFILSQKTPNSLFLFRKQCLFFVNEKNKSNKHDIEFGFFSITDMHVLKICFYKHDRSQTSLVTKFTNKLLYDG